MTSEIAALSALSAPETPFSVGSYPTHSPPPPIPSRANKATAAPNTTTTRPFYAECGELLRTLRRESHSRSAWSSSSAAQLKYRAILDEVSHLNRLLEVSAEEHADAMRHLRGEMEHTDGILKQREMTLREANREISQLRAEVQKRNAFLSPKHHEGASRAELSETCGDTLCPNLTSIAETTHTRSAMAAEAFGVSSSFPLRANGAFVSASYSPNTGVCVAHSALHWVRFLLERHCLSSMPHLEHICALLTELKQHAISNDIHTTRALCVRVSNALVELYGTENTFTGNEKINHHKPQTITADSFSSPSELVWQQRVSELTAERDTLRRQLDAISAENVELLQHWRSGDDAEEFGRRRSHFVRNAQTTSSSHTREETNAEEEERHALLLAERDRQAAWIAELEERLQSNAKGWMIHGKRN